MNIGLKLSLLGSFRIFTGPFSDYLFNCERDSQYIRKSFGFLQDPFLLLLLRTLLEFDEGRFLFTTRKQVKDKIMMSQLTDRKKGLTHGSFQVSKDINYADKQSIVPWGPRFSKSIVQDMQINMAISAVFEMGEDDGRGLRMGKRLLRSLGFVFSCIAISSLGFNGVLNVIELLGRFIPAFLYNNQEMFVTSATTLMLYIEASLYRR